MKIDLDKIKAVSLFDDTMCGLWDGEMVKWSYGGGVEKIPLWANIKMKYLLKQLLEERGVEVRDDGWQS